MAGQGRSRREARACEELRRAAERGAVIHAVTRSVADELVDGIGVDRSRVVVALPGIGPSTEVGEDPTGVSRITVLATGRQDLDAEIARRLAGTSEVAVSIGEVVEQHSRCLVIAAPLDGFSAAAVTAMAAGVPIVAVRSPAAVELLTGAATFVEPSELDELTDVAVALAGTDDARAINVAAGRARASDFTWALRVPAITAMYGLALSAAR
jgi:glycosyltransferase involved in cell wall biosynthesis